MEDQLGSPGIVDRNHIPTTTKVEYNNCEILWVYSGSISSIILGHGFAFFLFLQRLKTMYQELTIHGSNHICILGWCTLVQSCI